MKDEDFRKIVQHRLIHCEYVLSPKGAEYSRNGDRLHNFKDAAEIQECTPEQAALGMWMKHVVSIRDIVNDLPKIPDQRQVEEKFTDAINYLLLLEALLTERRDL